ncbi:MAG: class I SAM-dependent methyltransferase [Candidatus ainarchaeum sp.]|nr:class I SAM-dependent methyltransferase [Candidatus ainarchaeum sp.]
MDKSEKELIKAKFSKNIFYPDRKSLEMSTPELVSKYRASRLKCNTAIDLCCGLGIDAILLAKSCKKVIAIEKDKKILDCAIKNAKLYNTKNIEFICADFKTLDLKKYNPDIIFADPSRRVGEKRVKELSETEPSTTEIISLLQKQGFENFCIEVSNNLDLEKLNFDCEKEFISLNKEPNCISLYFGNLKKYNYSFVALPDKKVIFADKINPEFKTQENFKKYLYELDEGIKKMHFQNELLNHYNGLYAITDSFFTSTNLIKDPIFKNSYKIETVLETSFENTDKNILIEELKKLDAKKVVLRIKIDPDKYYSLKKDLEKDLEGTKKLHIIELNKKVILCKNLLLSE